jgi:Flp pilus assembly protein TadB
MNTKRITEQEWQAAEARVIRKGLAAMAALMFAFILIVYVLVDVDMVDPLPGGVAVVVVAAVQAPAWWALVRAARQRERFIHGKSK